MADPEENTDPRTILESFGKHAEPFTCAICGEARRYYDMLNDNTMLCLECSTKGGYEHDKHVAINVRAPKLMSNATELIEIRKELIHWDLAKGSVPLAEVFIPKGIAEEVLKVAKRERSLVNVLVTTSLRMMVQAYQHDKEDETSG